jgi:hypothetical protein
MTTYIIVYTHFQSKKVFTSYCEEDTLIAALKNILTEFDLISVNAIKNVGAST